MNPLLGLLAALVWCSLVAASHRHGARIIGGHVVSITEAPFVVFVGSSLDGEIVNPCGGVLVGSQIVLTAARCVPLAMTTLYIRYGTDDYANKEALTFKIGLPGNDPNEYKKIVEVHPYYNSPDNANQLYDIAAIKLPVGINITASTRPIGIEETRWPGVERRICRFYGFGLNKVITEEEIEASTPLSMDSMDSRLEFAEVALKYKQACQCLGGNDFIMCADLNDQPQVLQDMDIGSPVVCDNKLSGVSSARITCNGVYAAEKYTYLYPLHDWLMKIMGNTKHFHHRSGSFASKTELPHLILFTFLITYHLMLY